MSTMTIENSAVANAMTSAGYGHYASRYSGLLAQRLRDHGVSRDTVQSYARENGVHISTVVADAFIAALGQQETADVPAEGFDRDRAASVVRTYAEQAGANMDEVENVLIEAGLVDPQPEPEADPEPVDAGLIQRLVEFARSHGFRG